MLKRLLTILGLLVVTLAFAGRTFASSDMLSIQLEQPKTPTYQDTFGITFVALDTNNDALTVTCYKKGPSDSSFSQFSSPITLPNGGGTDNCSVTSSVINTTGTFQFYAVVSNGTDTATTSTVSVDHETGGPDTPTNYSKDHPSSCTYVIHFTTANDNNKTVKVEVYRSTNTSFSADSSTRVYSVSVGSNSTQTFTDTVPDCSKDYYYVVRAFDNAGNGSGTVGDSSVTVTNPTTVTQSTNGAIPVSNSQVTQPETSVTPTEAPTGEATNQTSGEKSVLGSQKSPSVVDQAMNALTSHKKVSFLVVLTLVVLLAGVYFWLRQKKNTSR